MSVGLLVGAACTMVGLLVLAVVSETTYRDRERPAWLVPLAVVLAVATAGLGALVALTHGST